MLTHHISESHLSQMLQHLISWFLLGDPVTAGGYGGKFNSLLVSCLIYFTRSVSDIALVSFSNPCQQKHPLLFWIYLEVSSRTGQEAHSNVITSFFNGWGLILLNCSNIFFYIIFQNHICHKCCDIWYLTSIVAWRSCYYWWIWRTV